MASKKRASSKSTRFYQATPFWKGVSIFLFIVVLILLFPAGDYGGDLGAEDITGQVSYFLETTMQPGTRVSIDKVEDVGSVYMLDAVVGNESATIFASKDGRFLFPGAIDMTGVLSVGGSEDSRRIDVSEDDDPFIGSKDSPVVIVSFSDYECPYCRKFALETFPQIKSEYIDSGSVRFVFRDMPASYHENAQLAAEAAQCAHEQGLFWEFHDELFSASSLSESKILGIAEDLGLDMVSFKDCINSGKYVDEIANDAEDGRMYGVQGTPSFFVNGVLVSGALDYDSFSELIDAELGGS